MRQWYVARSKPKREMSVAVQLERDGVETYLPRIRQRRRGALSILQPLFPSYLFVKLDLSSDDYLRTRSAPGVAYVLGCDGVPTPLPDTVVDAIRTREQDALKGRWQPRFSPGDRVTIVSGPFKDVDAIFEEGLSAAGRVRVLIRLLRRWCPVQIDADSLRRSSKP